MPAGIGERASGPLPGAAVTGLGFGPAFTGAYRWTVALAPPEERAALIAPIYIVVYVASAIPVMIGGIGTTHYGWHATALVYSLAVAGVAALATIARVYQIITTGRHGLSSIPPKLRR